MTDAEILEKFGVTEEQLDSWEEEAAQGVFHGEPRKIVVGRPIPDATTKPVDTREVLTKCRPD